MEKEDATWKYDMQPKYKGTVKREAVKGVDGFTFEVYADNKEELETELKDLYEYGKGLTLPAPLVCDTGCKK